MADKCVFPSRLHFQRVAGFEAVNSRLVNVRPMSSSSLTGRRFAPGSALMDALKVCAVDALCQGFNFNSAQAMLDVVEMDTRNTRRNESVPLRPTAGVAYFESQCLQGICSRFRFQSAISNDYATINPCLIPFQCL